MERCLRPGYQVTEKVFPRPKGRPKRQADEGALDLGQKRQRLCGSKKGWVDEQRMRDMERQIELLQSERASSDEKVAKVLQLQEQTEEHCKQLRELLMKRSSGTTISYHSIPFNTTQYHLIPFNTIYHHLIPFNAI